jgi:TonB-linked SusC/RagA family outer membrane protein
MSIKIGHKKLNYLTFILDFKKFFYIYNLKKTKSHMRKILTLFIMLMFSGILAFAQNRVVTGTVTDNKGVPIEGASVRIKGSRTGIATDAGGNFSISVSPGATLVFSGVGIAPQEVAVGTQSTVNVSLTTTETELTNVVVTAAGIRRTEKSLGYAVTKVDPNILVQKSEPDLLKALQGQVAGVDIRTSQGTPGAATRIQIRGNSSFFGDNKHFIIVVVVQYSNDQVTTSDQTSGGGAYGSGISDLDQNDIASMNVLKGSSASALYGSRASNGVIIITTKSGGVSRARKGFEVNFKSSVSFETIANLPDYQNTFGTGSQGVLGGGSNGSWGKHFAAGDSQAVWTDYKNAYPNLFTNGKVAYQAHPDNVSSLFRTGVVYENSIGFNGGDEKTSFSLTASQLNHSGYVPNSKFDRSNLSVGGGTKTSIGLNIRGNLSYSRSNQEGGLFGENQSTTGTASSEFGRSLFLGRSWDLTLPFEDAQGNDVSFLSGQFDNPFWSYKYNTSKTYEERVIAGMHLDFNLTKWAKVDYNIGSNLNYLNRTEVAEISTRATGLGSITEDNYRNQQIASTFLLSLTPDISKDFSVKTILGTSYDQGTTTRNAVVGNIFIVRGIHNLNNTSTQTVLTDVYSRRRLLGVFGDVTLGYKNWAFVTATGRNDWSSTLPQANRSYFYPSISGSIIFTDALKISNSILDYGKLRGGWAKVGRDADPYSLEDVFNINTNFLGQTRGSVQSTANNPALKPEFTKEVELGTQLSFFKRRIELDFTWYKKISTNLIAPVTTAASTGYTQLFTNYGSISNKGVEIELTVRPIRTENFTWEAKAVFTQNKNIVESLIAGVTRINLGGGFNTYSTYLEPGKPFGFIRGTKTVRDSATGQFLINPADGTMILDPNSDMIGDPNPDFKLGINNTFTYKGFFLSALFDWTKGGDIYSVTVSSELGRGVTQDTKDRETGWVIPGIYGNPITRQPILVGGKPVPNQTRITTNDLYFSPAGGNTYALNTASEWNVYDATVYRLREVSIGYNIPKTMFKKLPIGSMSLSVTGRNLWYLAPGFPKHTHFDPEVSTYGSASVQGLEFSAAPTSKRIGINLNVTF